MSTTPKSADAIHSFIMTIRVDINVPDYETAKEIAESIRPIADDEKTNEKIWDMDVILVEPNPAEDTQWYKE